MNVHVVNVVNPFAQCVKWKMCGFFEAAKPCRRVLNDAIEILAPIHNSVILEPPTASGLTTLKKPTSAILPIDDFG